jgi:benzodiazapine receptor
MKTFPIKNVKWWQAALFLVAVNGVSRLLSISNKKSRFNYHKKLNPQWAPPAKLFPPAWFFNNIVQMWGTVKLINNSPDFPDKDKFLLIQGLIWLDYITYGLVGLKYNSTILSFIWTNFLTSLALYSFIKAYPHDKQVAFSFLPLTLWGLYATTLADYEVLFNTDPLFKTKRLLTPPESGIFRPRVGVI